VDAVRGHDVYDMATVRKRQQYRYDEPAAAQHLRRENTGLIPFSALWSAFTSQLGAELPLPVETTTLGTTVVQTSFITTSITTGMVQSPPPPPPPSQPSTSTGVPATTPTTHHSTSLTSGSGSSDAPLASRSSDLSSTGRQDATTSVGGSSSLPTTLSSVVASSSPSLTESPASSHFSLTGTPSLTITLATHAPLSTSFKISSASHATHNNHKQAIIGVLTGTIAGLMLIGILIAIFVRRRRKHRELDDPSASESGNPSLITEKGIRPTISRKWTEITNRGTPKTPTQFPQSRSPAMVDEEHHIIRMSTHHWPRPFAHGEGIRDSTGPGQLRVVNPDLSRPGTPRMSTETAAGSFLRKQRYALAAALAGANRSFTNLSLPSRSRASSRSASFPAPQQQMDQHVPPVPPVPDITIDPVLSQECMIHPALRTPSYRSYPSLTSLPLVSQQPPEDPFITPPEEKELPELPKPRRPSIAPLQSAAGRTLSSFGSALNPFRTKSNVVIESVRSWSQQTSDSISSRFSSRGATGMERWSNPFDLRLDDEEKMAERRMTRSAEHGRLSQTRHMGVYEGT
jgi:hypothetical protein